MTRTQGAWHIGWSLLGVLGAAVACSSVGALGSAADSKGDLPSGSPEFNGAGNGGGGGDESLVGSSTGGATAGLPAETETNANFELPEAGQRFVYSANPDNNSVAVIDGTTLGIHTVEAGAQPKFLQTLGGADAAIVLNVGSSDATILRTAIDGTSATSKVDVQRGSNAIAVAPDGKHAVVYYDETLSAGNTPGSFQDVSVVDLVAGNDRSIGMTIGFRPSQVFFSNDGKRAFAATQDGVSILDFADIDKNGAGIADTVPLGNTGIDKPLDVSVTADGRYALAREDATSELRLIDLGTRQISRLDLATLAAVSDPVDAGTPSPSPSIPDAGTPGTDGGDAPRTDGGVTPPTPPPLPPPAIGPSTITDVDLSPDGSFAMAVLRERSAAVRLPIPGAFTNPSLAKVTLVPGELIGSVTLSPTGKYALLYTTADDTNERLTVLPLADGGKPVSYQLRKSIDAVAIAPDDQTALIVHKKLTGDPNEAGIDPEVKLDREDGYSVVRLDTGFAKLQVTQTSLGPFSIVPDGSELFILFNATGVNEVQKVDLRSFLVQPIELGSPPISVGPVPTSKNVFVGQDHPDGRISFIDWTTGSVQSVTGFELNSRIQQ